MPLYLMNTITEPIQGLSKREQTKLQKIIKASEVNKAQTHAKSYKRKAKGKHPEQCAQRKLIKTEPDHSEQQSEQKKIALFNPQDKNEEEGTDKKKKLRMIKPFNPRFQLQGGQEELFAYIMTYAYEKKSKRIDEPVVDPSFLDDMEGEPLQQVRPPTQDRKSNGIKEELETVRSKILAPFDEAQKSLADRVGGGSRKGT